MHRQSSAQDPGSTRVCRMETCKAHHCIAQLVASLTPAACSMHKHSSLQDPGLLACSSWAEAKDKEYQWSSNKPWSHTQIAGRWITHKRFPQRTPKGALGSAEWKLVRFITAQLNAWQAQLQQHAARTNSQVRKILACLLLMDSGSRQAAVIEHHRTNL